MTLSVDGVEVDATRTVAYKGMMLTGVPNFAFAIGYTNASWTLKCDLVSRYVVRLLDHLQEHGYAAVTPVEPPEPERLPLLDLSAGYVQRAAGALPSQGIRPPWKLNQNYRKDVALLTRGPLDDEGVRFTRRSRRPPTASTGTRRMKRYVVDGGTAVLTGAAGGIGRATAHELAATRQQPRAARQERGRARGRRSRPARAAARPRGHDVRRRPRRR